MELNLTTGSIDKTNGSKEPEEKIKFTLKSCRNQIFLALILGLGYLSLVFINMYTTRLLFHQFSLDLEKQEEYRKITWAINLLPILGTVIGGVVTHFLGRKGGILSSVTIFIAAIFITPFFINDENALLCVIFVRAFYLIAIGIFYVIATIYISETTHPKIRDQLGLTAVLFKILGTLIFDVTRTCPKLLFGFGIGQSLVFLVALLWIGRESPYWFVSKWKRDDANSTFAWLNKELTGEVSDEKIKQIFRLNRDDKKSYFSHVFHRKSLKPLTIICLLIFYQQFTGESTIRKQTPEILKSVDWTSIFWEITALVFASVAIVLVPIWKKKGLLLVSALVIIVSLVLKSVFTYIENEDENDELYDMTSTWIKVSYVMFNVGYACGWMFIPWLVMGQLLPCKDICSIKK